MDHFEKQQEFLSACQNLDLTRVDFTDYRTDGFGKVCSALYPNFNSKLLIGRDIHSHLFITLSGLSGFPSNLLIILSDAYNAKEWDYAVKCLELYVKSFN